MKTKKCKIGDSGCPYHACMSDDCQKVHVFANGGYFGPGNCFKKVTYVLMVSTNFPIYHSKAGQPTGFEEKILTGKKIHTIRENYELWVKRAEKINKGDAVLSIRKWSGKPRKSKQVEICKKEYIHVQKLEWCGKLSIDGKHFSTANDSFLTTLSKNDGLTMGEFLMWFQGCEHDLMAIIHFTDLKY